MTPKTRVRPKTVGTKAESPGAGRDDAVSENAPKVKRAFEIDIFKGWCKCCGICAAFCPRECIRLDEDGSPFIEEASRCTGCGWCELHCPDFAISVHEKRPKKTPPPED